MESDENKNKMDDSDSITKEDNDTTVDNDNKMADKKDNITTSDNESMHSSKSEVDKVKSKSTSSDDKRKIMFFALTPLEQENLIFRLKEQILQSSSIMNGRCCLFCGWLCGSFLPNAAKPAPTVLTENLEYIDQNFNETEEDEPDRLFFEGGNEDKIKEYYQNIKDNKKLDLPNSDIYSLAIACRKYMEIEIEFLDEELYNKCVELFREDEEYVIERLPFLLSQRNMVKDMLDIAAKENVKSFYEDWGKVVFKNDNNREINGQMIKALTRANYNEVDEKFF